MTINPDFKGTKTISLMSKLLILFIFGLSVTSIADDYRSFTDVQGRTLKAKIILVDKGAKKVTLERENKKKATVSISIFSEADQEYINAWSPVTKPETSEPAKSELTEQQLRSIANKYIKAWGERDFDLLKSLYANEEHLKENDFNRHFWNSMVKMNLRGVKAGYIQLEIDESKCNFMNAPYTEIYIPLTHKYEVWVLPTPDGKIKYDSLLVKHPIHIAYESCYFVEVGYGKRKGQYQDKRQLKYDANRSLKSFKKTGVPMFELDISESPMHVSRKFDDIYYWLKKNGESWDSSEPKVYCPESIHNFLIRNRR